MFVFFSLVFCISLFMYFVFSQPAGVVYVVSRWIGRGSVAPPGFCIFACFVFCLSSILYFFTSVFCIFADDSAAFCGVCSQ